MIGRVGRQTLFHRVVRDPSDEVWRCRGATIEKRSVIVTSLECLESWISVNSVMSISFMMDVNFLMGPKTFLILEKNGLIFRLSVYCRTSSILFLHQWFWTMRSLLWQWALRSSNLAFSRWSGCHIQSWFSVLLQYVRTSQDRSSRTTFVGVVSCARWVYLMYPSCKNFFVF